MAKKIFIIAGEASGDLHGGNLVKELLIQNSTLDIQGWGGDYMQENGATIIKHYKDLAFMGFVEVIKNINTIRKNFALCKQQINNFKPDAVIFVDYPGFNLRMAKWVKMQGITTIYYISPQIWAWKASRIHQIKQYVDKMLVILPFENEFYQKWDYPVTYVGHPLASHIQSFKNANTTNKPVPNLVAILPGSRKQEVKNMLPIMASVAKHFPNYIFKIAKAPHLDESLFNLATIGNSNVSIANESTYELLHKSCAALVTSGTATLETALFNVPQVVCYKGNAVSFAIAKKLIKIKYISLVNLIMDKPIIQELIQNQLTENNLATALKIVFENKTTIQKNYADLQGLLQTKGYASSEAALHVLQIL